MALNQEVDLIYSQDKDLNASTQKSKSLSCTKELLIKTPPYSSAYKFFTKPEKLLLLLLQLHSTPGLQQQPKNNSHQN
jgi:hypothetical protein